MPFLLGISEADLYHKVACPCATASLEETLPSGYTWACAPEPGLFLQTHYLSLTSIELHP